ncbi:MAG: hypothetical protein V3T70_00210 [Phycisphaerae bacterium]
MTATLSPIRRRDAASAAAPVWLDPSRPGPWRLCRVLVIPPYAGDFGWELMNWQARIRRLLRISRAERVLVFGAPDKRRLYEGGVVEYVPIEPPRLPGHASDDRRVDDANQGYAPHAVRDAVWEALAPLVRDGIAESGSGRINVLAPPYDGAMWPTTTGYQDFVPLHNPVAARDCERLIDVVLIPRTRTVAAERNRPAQWWSELSEALSRHELSCHCAPPMLSRAAALFSHCRLAAGGSTGGLHLAALCGCPHYVWGSDDRSRWTAWNITNRQRYESLWNPLGTPVSYDPLGWKPGLQSVVDGIRRALDAIGRTRPGPVLNHGPLQRAARRVSVSLRVGGDAIRLPWRLRQWLEQRSS